MRSTFKVLFFLKRDKQKANGTIPLFCRITVDGQEVRFSMKCDVNPNHWDTKTGKASGRTAEAGQINSLVDATKAAIYKIYRELQEKESYVTAEKIKNVFLGIEARQQTLLELFDRHNRERKQQAGINITQYTYEKYCLVRRIVADFILYKYNLQDIPIKEVNLQFLSGYEIYLYTVHEYKKNTVVSAMKKLRHIINVALNEELIYKNPFKDFKLQWQKTDRGYLTQTELETMIDAQFENKRMEKARDIFIFCAFTGISYADIKHLTYDNIQSSFDGKLWIKGRRRKTNTEYNIPVLNIPKMILEKYKDEAIGNLAMPIISLTNYNLLLKKIAKSCGITKNVSSHLARHSFATLALTQGVSIESVSKMLGHSNISITQVYAKITNKKVGNEMNQFAGNIKRLDKKMQLIPDLKEMSIEGILQSLKISTGRASDTTWEKLIAKVWNRLSDIDRHTFAFETNNKEDKPKVLRDFYESLIDYFLDCTGNNSNNGLSENIKTQFAVNY